MVNKSSANIPKLKGNFALGKLSNFLEKDGEGIIHLLNEAKAKMHAENVSMCQFRLGLKRVLLLADEELIEIFKTKYELHLDYDMPLLTKFLGNTISNENYELWGKERKILLNNIHGKNLNEIANNVLMIAKRHIGYAAAKSKPEFKALFSGFALDVFTNNYVGIEHTEQSVNEFVDLLNDLTGNVLQLRNVFKWALPSLFRKMLFPGEEGLDATLKLMRKRFLNLYHAQKRNGEVPLFMQQLQQLVNESERESKDNLPLDQINIDDLFARILYTSSAAAATTAATLQFAVLLISSHRHIQEKLQNELNSHSININTLNDLNEIDLKKLTYLDCVINEVFRLFPPIPFYIPRKTIKAFTLEDMHIKPGELVIAAPYIWQNLERNYRDASKFNPDRFLSHDISKPKAFSMGPRTCPGKHLAMLEVKTMLIILYSQYRIELDNPNISDASDIELTLRDGALTPKHPYFGKLINKI